MEPTLGNGKICYIEIPASDIDRSARFYSGARRPQPDAGLLVYIPAGNVLGIDQQRQ